MAVVIAHHGKPGAELSTRATASWTFWHATKSFGFVARHLELHYIPMVLVHVPIYPSHSLGHRNSGNSLALHWHFNRNGHNYRLREPQRMLTVVVFMLCPLTVLRC